ncbi:unnamed protein product [Trifolium pratense]|uniref:Uncharacterized protein n=1 Tax=Trifolium pratense TaxID=57577 RepID=A0ACB0K8L6_TRIPR|nr:unnamed protein product [Trifolium pratense]
MGAYFEKIGSTSFAVYSIAVTDAQNRTWFVKRRYRNFERLHRQLKDIPNYTLHLPPKRIFSSSNDDAFVHQRCIQLDKYLQVSGSPSLLNEGPSASTTLYLPWNADELDRSTPQQSATASVLSTDTEEGDRSSNLGHEIIDREEVQDNEWQSDNALISKGYLSLVTDHTDETSNLNFDRKRDMSEEAWVNNDVPVTNFSFTRDT